MPTSQEQTDSHAAEIIILQDEQNLAGLIQQIENCSSETVAITRSSMETNLDFKRGVADCQWIPFERNSFADFVYHELGGQIASVWLPLADVGLILASRDSWLSALKECDSWPQALVMLNWAEVSSRSCQNIDWSNSSSQLPGLEPHTDRISNPTIKKLLQQSVRWLPKSLDPQSPDFQAVMAGLYQWYDALNTSHEFSQSVQYTGRNNAGDYWHAIMHRREGDYSNAKYWFRNVGAHPLYPTLKKAAESLARQSSLNLPDWTPERFVDLCSRVESGTELEEYALRLQALEMVLLMRQTLDDATL